MIFGTLLALRRAFQLFVLFAVFTTTCASGRSATGPAPVAVPTTPTALPQTPVAAPTITIPAVLPQTSAAVATTTPATLAPPSAGDNSITAASTITLYLPAVTNNTPPNTIFGVQMGSISDTSGLQQLVGTQSSWVRSGHAVLWDEVEPVEGGGYNWSALSGHEQEWMLASSNHLADFVMVRGAPVWAQAQPGYACGPILPSKLAAFGNFMHALVARYSQAPYNLKYWEIGNEPDVDYRLVSGDGGIGCWGNQDDMNYGGSVYADMLKVVYPQIKSADPTAQVVVGGLLLDCDPIHPPPGKAPCLPARFLEGVLAQGGGPYFDVVGIHAYDAYTGVLGGYYMPNWNSSSTSTTGPTMALVAKANYVRALLAAHGVTGKLVANNESALGWGVPTADATFETTKAYYVPELFATAMAQHILADIWYSMDDDWHHQGLIGPGLTMRPALIAYQFASQQLAAAQFSQAITSYPGVQGYIFNRQMDTLWIMWSPTGSIKNLTLPGVPTSVHHVDGTVMVVTTNQLTLGPEPLYVQWNP